MRLLSSSLMRRGLLKAMKRKSLSIRQFRLPATCESRSFTRETDDFRATAHLLRGKWTTFVRQPTSYAGNGRLSYDSRLFTRELGDCRTTAEFLRGKWT